MRSAANVALIAPLCKTSRTQKKESEAKNDREAMNTR